MVCSYFRPSKAWSTPPAWQWHRSHSSVETDAYGTARVIQEQLLKDFANLSEMSNWFDREEQPPPKEVVRRPNPRNVENAEKIKELEEDISK